MFSMLLLPPKKWQVFDFDLFKWKQTPVFVRYTIKEAFHKNTSRKSLNNFSVKLNCINEKALPLS